MSKPALTQENLAAKLELMNVNLDRLSISRIESGDRFVADYEVVAIAKALNVSLDWLLLVIIILVYKYFLLSIIQ